MMAHSWGDLEWCEAYGRAGDLAEDYTIVSYKEASIDFRHYMQACHAFIFARDKRTLWDLYQTRAAILMQNRFDGMLGFPGGLVDDGPNEDPVIGLNRELQEEVGLDLNKHRCTESDHVISYVHHDKKLCLHLFGLELTMEEFVNIEKCVMTSADYGTEVLGVVRPPLYTMGDGFRGFPAFLTNNFAGNARHEFLHSLKHFKILSAEELDIAWNSAKKFIKEAQC